MVSTVCIPVQNLSCGLVELESGVTLDQVHSVTVREHPGGVTEQRGEASKNSSEPDLAAAITDTDMTTAEPPTCDAG